MKTYQQPALEARHIEPTDLVATTIPIGGDNVDESEKVKEDDEKWGSVW